jgi:hypothetical protein
MQRLIAPDVAEGPSAHSFRPASFQIQQSSMRMVTPRGFDTRPPAYVPNSSPSQARFKESTPMSQSYDLFYGGPRKRHPCTLGFDCDLNLGIGSPCDGFDSVC